MLQREVQSVMERSASAGVNGVESLGQIILVTREFLVDVNLVVKVDEKDLVLWLAGPDKGHCSFVYALPLGSHAAAVIDDQAERHRHILLFENGDLLLYLVVKHR